MRILGTISSSRQINTNDFAYIATVTADGNSDTLDFQNISQDYKHLRLICMLKTTNSTANNTRMRWAFNNDTTNSNYYGAYYVWEGDGSSVIRGFENDRLVGIATQSYTGQTAQFAMNILEIMNYTGTQKKGAKFRGGTAKSAANGGYAQYSLLWNNTSAINRITVSATSGNFYNNSKITLYGIKGN